jgi:hypothetical protein
MNAHYAEARPPHPARLANRNAVRQPSAAGPFPSGLLLPGAHDAARVRPAHLLALQTHVGNKAAAQVAVRASRLRMSRPAHKPVRRPKAKRPMDVMRRPAIKSFLQRAVACPPAPTAPQQVAPTEDPRFTRVTDDVSDASRIEKSHPSAKTKVAEAQGAAAGPPNEVKALAGAGQVDKMGAAKPGTFDKAAFIAAVAKAIDAAAPKNPEEATKFKDSGKTAEVKQQVSGLVTKGKDDSAHEIKTATTAAPDSSAAKPKAVTPMAPEQPGPAAGPVAGDQAMPAPRRPDETELGAGPCAVNNKLADAEVTEDQLKKGNEPQFDQALDSKQKVEEHAAQAPPEVKAAEGAQLDQAQAGAAGTVASGLAAMHGGRGSALGGITAHKNQAKAADEAKRAEISTHMEQVFTKTKAEVGATLDGLDQQVSDVFDKGEKTARDTFDNNVGKEVDDWKDERYSGLRGKWRWVKDKFAGLPPEVNQIYARNRATYLANMQKVISDVADVVGSTLAKAKQRIAEGRSEIKAYVASQPAALRKFANEAADKMSDQFDSLDNDVDSKQESVVSDLAQKYVAARQSVDDSITKMQEENKGLIQKAVDAVEAVVGIILKMKDMLANVLSRAANAIGGIIAHPIAFLENLVNAVKAGLSKFVNNIGEHLKKGLLDWLLGALSSAGIELPENFDLKGILNLALSIMGLTWASIRGRLVAKVGEPVMAKMEQTVDVFKIIATDGLGGLWNWIVDRVGDFKEMVMGEIREFISEKVIKAGIEWLIGILNPAAAFIKACEAIYNIVMFFVEKGKEIIEFVNSILDSVESILSGGVGAVADLIEGTLAKTIPLIINFLADLLGLGGISEKIKEIIGKIQAPVNKAIDAVIGGALKIGKKMFGALMGKAPAGGEKEKAALEQAGSALRSSRSHADAEKRLAPLRDRFSLPLTLVVENREARGELVHVQTMATPSYELTFADSDVEGSEDLEASASMWEQCLGQATDDSQIRVSSRRPTKAGLELGQTRARPVRLSEHSVQNNLDWIRKYANASTATSTQRSAAIDEASASIEKASQSQDEDSVYRYLRAAATRIQDLYGGRDKYSLDVEHLTEVAQNKETFVRTRIDRKGKSVTERILSGHPRPGTPEEQIAAMKVPAAQKREIARLYAQELVDESLGDVAETTSADGPEEIELLIIGTAIHAAITARRTRERSGI